MNHSSKTNFLSFRDERLTDYLREQIATGKLSPPLPNSREWAKSLGIGCRTLYRSLHTLEREGVVEIIPRKGIFIRSTIQEPLASPAENIVRLVYQGSDCTDFHMRNRWCDLLFFLSQRLKLHNIHLLLEKCTDARLRAISKIPQSECPRELLILRSLSERNQRLFANSARPSLVFGYRPPEISLPYVNFDLEGAIRHATHRFFRRGYRHVWFLVNQSKSYGVQRQRDAFSAACQSWVRQPVSGEVISIPIQPDAQLDALKRFSSRPREKHAILVLAPLIFTTVVVALLRHRRDLLEDVEMVSVGGMPDPASIWPDETHYCISIDSAIKTITHAAAHFFQTGIVSNVSKTIPLEISKR